MQGVIVLLGLSALCLSAWAESEAPLSYPAQFTSPTPKPPCDSHFFDRDRLETLISSQKLNRITQIVDLAPNCFKGNQIAVYESMSLQCATPKAPRIILSLNDDIVGETVCTFNSGNSEDYAEFYRKNPDIDCHENAMECQRFNPQTQRFEYYEIQASQDDKGNAVKSKITSEGGLARISPVNPPQCMTSCHRGESLVGGKPDPRPNLDAYPAWPGFYGSMHDKPEQFPAETELYQNTYLPYKKTNLRYQAMDRLDPQVPVEKNEKSIVNLHNALSLQNFKRVAARIADPSLKEKIWPYRYAILGALACDDENNTEYSVLGKDPKGKTLYMNNKTLKSTTQTPVAPRKFGIETFIPEKIRKEFVQNFEKTASQALRWHLDNMSLQVAQLKKVGQYSTSAQFEGIRQEDSKNDPSRPSNTYKMDEDFWRSARLAYLGKNLGMSIEDWSMTFRPTLDFNAGRQNPKVMLPALAAAFLDPEKDKDLHLDLDSHLYRYIDPVPCEKLRQKSLQALNAVGAGVHSGQCSSCRDGQTSKAVADQGLLVGNELLKRVPSVPAQIATCIACHGPQSSSPIPFGDEPALKKALSGKSKTHPERTLQAELDLRIDSGDMPKSSTFNSDEKLALKAYFKNLRD